VYNSFMQLPEVIDRVRPSIVQIRRAGPNLPPQGATIGTGFMVADAQHIVTAFHVVDAIDAGAGEVLHVAFAGPDVDTPTIKIRASFAQFNGQVIATDQDRDIALLYVPDFNSAGLRIEVGGKPLQANPTPAKLHTGKIREGIELAVSGYPLGEPSLVTNAGILASTFSPTDQAAGIQLCYLGDFTANPGNSGGPVYTGRDGSVVGVCVAGRLAPIVGGKGAQSVGLTVIVPIEQVVELVKAQGIDPSQTPVSAPRSTQTKQQHRRRR
jgi:serine protease Do